MSGRRALGRRGGALVAAALAAVLAERVLLWDRYTVPSGSMEPTLLVGDSLLVDKSAYGYGPLSLPWVDLGFRGRLLAAEPSRGDVVVFRNPVNGETYVKRLVGLPGDRLRVSAGRLAVNGAELPLDFLDGDRFAETLPGGARHVVARTGGPGDDTPEYLVPPGHYFMMGDNRNNSLDSRWPDKVGYVPAENLLGRVERVLWSVRSCLGSLPCGLRGGRFLLAPDAPPSP